MNTVARPSAQPPQISSVVVPEHEPLTPAIASENIVLACCVECPSMLPRIQEILSAEDFRLNDHARVFTVLEGLRQQNAPIDYVTVADALGGRPEDFQLIAGILHGAVIEKNHCVYHARIVRRKSQQRGGIHIAERMAIAFADPHCDLELAINQFIGEIQALAVRI